VKGGGAIDLVQVYTVARRPADPRVGSLTDARLEEIAARVRAIGLVAEVYGAG
jgi:mRNA-degrading endonuclease toxin of MazEF toxin-antitoxin module